MTPLRIIVMGTGPFAVPMFTALRATPHTIVAVVTRPDHAPPGRRPPRNPMREAAAAAGVGILDPERVNEPTVVASLAALRPDLFVVCDYGQILSRDLLAVPPLGGINLHGSLLPRHRGAAPVQWAVINGDPETGVAIMQLDEGMDTGPVLLERRVTIDPHETSGELLARLAPIGAQALLEALTAIAEGRAHAVPQDHAGATHAAMLDKTHGHIDFTQPARALAARIRGVDPWPGAQALHRGQVVKLFRAVDRGRPPGTEVPGTVVAIDDAGLHVVCGEDLAVIREIQAPGRKRLTAAQFAAGRGIAVGDVLRQPVLEPAVVSR